MSVLHSDGKACNILGVARGPFKATVFFLTEAMAASGMAVLPFLRMGVTSTSSHSMGTCLVSRDDIVSIIE